MKKSGIYQIKNNINGKRYIGSAKNLKRRWTRHKSMLNNNCHHNIYLQRSWNKYSAEKFEFSILETTDENLLKIEQNYLDKLNPEYNLAPACGGDIISNHPDKERICNDISISLKKLYKQGKKKFPNNSGKNNPNWQGGIYKEKTTCPNCGSEKYYYSKLCENCHDKSGKNNPFYGKKHTKETRKKMSENRKGKYYGNQQKKVIAEDKEYASLSACAEEYNVVPATILNRIKSDNYPDFNYK